MDEPCSALDPIATAKIEDLMQELVADYTIVIVTHNMQQAARVSDRTAFFTVEVHDDGSRTGTIVEFDRTETIFTEPERPADRGLRDGAVRMTRETFHEELEKIELELLSLGELAGTAVQRAVEALVQHDDEKAQAVIDGDDQIDELYLKIDSDVLRMLALQSPVAEDLRLISAILHSCLHLERIGDQAVNVAKMYLHTKDARGANRCASSSRRWARWSSRWSAPRWRRSAAGTSISHSRCR